jgi:hypothetical protein
VTVSSPEPPSPPRAQSLIGEQRQQPAALVDLRIEAVTQIANRLAQILALG